jgi:hypothetical protein
VAGPLYQKKEEALDDIREREKCDESATKSDPALALLLLRARDQGKAVNLTDSISMLVFGYSLLPSVPQEKGSKCCPLVVRALHNKSMIKAGTG